MKNRATLIAIPVVVAIAYLALQAFFVDEPARRIFFTVEVMTMKLLAAAGCFVAASRYRRREYMGIAWQVIGIDYFLLFVKDLLFGRVIHLPGIDPDTAESVRVGFVIIANVGGSIGCIMLARVWHVAGIALPGSRRIQYAAMVIGVAFAVAIVGWGTWQDLHNLHNGNKEAMVAIGSNLGDIVSFSAIAPILLTAIAMRGGALAWPWALVTLSNVGWLLYDMSWSFERQWALSEHMLRIIAEFWRAQACAMALSAGLAQRWAIRSASRK
ncbi:MAG TPA: hypothetical protein VHB97_07900 [Polyangia bacterium]|jgi:hypothetical protein|nr:hypothetical protein [Polyangia bacterium]